MYIPYNVYGHMSSTIHDTRYTEFSTVSCIYNTMQAMSIDIY